MNFDKLYKKYKNKYINLKNQHAGMLSNENNKIFFLFKILPNNDEKKKGIEYIDLEYDIITKENDEEKQIKNINDSNFDEPLKIKIKNVKFKKDITKFNQYIGDDKLINIKIENDNFVLTIPELTNINKIEVPKGIFTNDNETVQNNELTLEWKIEYIKTEKNEVIIKLNEKIFYKYYLEHYLGKFNKLKIDNFNSNSKERIELNDAKELLKETLINKLENTGVSSNTEDNFVQKYIEKNKYSKPYLVTIEGEDPEKYPKKLIPTEKSEDEIIIKTIDDFKEFKMADKEVIETIFIFIKDNKNIKITYPNNYDAYKKALQNTNQFLDDVLLNCSESQVSELEKKLKSKNISNDYNLIKNSNNNNIEIYTIGRFDLRLIFKKPLKYIHSDKIEINFENESKLKDTLKEYNLQSIIKTPDKFSYDHKDRVLKIYTINSVDIEKEEEIKLTLENGALEYYNTNYNENDISKEKIFTVTIKVNIKDLHENYIIKNNTLFYKKIIMKYQKKGNVELIKMNGRYVHGFEFLKNIGENNYFILYEIKFEKGKYFKKNQFFLFNFKNELAYTVYFGFSNPVDGEEIEFVMDKYFKIKNNKKEILIYINGEEANEVVSGEEIKFVMDKYFKIKNNKKEILMYINGKIAHEVVSGRKIKFVEGKYFKIKNNKKEILIYINYTKAYEVRIKDELDFSGTLNGDVKKEGNIFSVKNSKNEIERYKIIDNESEIPPNSIKGAVVEKIVEELN